MGVNYGSPSLMTDSELREAHNKLKEHYTTALERIKKENDKNTDLLIKITQQQDEISNLHDQIKELEDDVEELEEEVFSLQEPDIRSDTAATNLLDSCETLAERENLKNAIADLFQNRNKELKNHGLQIFCETVNINR